jgi:hypothetical protein
MMKTIGLLLVGSFFCLSVHGSELISPEVGGSRLGDNSCTAQPISFVCSDGDSNIVPGCSVSCPDNQAAICNQGIPSIDLCSYQMPSCSCQ